MGGGAGFVGDRFAGRLALTRGDSSWTLPDYIAQHPDLKASPGPGPVPGPLWAVPECVAQRRPDLTASPVPVAGSRSGSLWAEPECVAQLSGK